MVVHEGGAVGSIVELGAWVIDHAIAEAATWPGRTDLIQNLIKSRLAP